MIRLIGLLVCWMLLSTAVIAEPAPDEESESAPKPAAPSFWKEAAELDDDAFFALLEKAVTKDIDREYPEEKASSTEDAADNVAVSDDEDEEEEGEDAEDEMTDEDEESAEEGEEEEGDEADDEEADAEEESDEEGESEEDEEGDDEDREEDYDEDSEEEWVPRSTREEILGCLTQMRAAYDAHMAFARCSLSVIREKYPEEYEQGLAGFRCALREQCCRDLDSMRCNNRWSPGSALPENNTPVEDAFVYAAVQGGSGFGVRGQTAYHIKHREDMVKLRQRFLAEQIELCTLSGREYITGNLFDELKEEAFYIPKPKPTPHCKEVLKLFRQAEKLWLVYASKGGMAYYSGDGSQMGSDSHNFAYFELIFLLWEHHEAFLLDLLTGCRVSYDE